MTLKPLRTALVLALMAGTGAPPTATAAPGARFGDGKPTPEACAEYGFHLGEAGEPYSVRSRRTSRTSQNYASPPAITPHMTPPPPMSVPSPPPLPIPPAPRPVAEAPPPPPPPPPPGRASVSQEVKVTGSRVRGAYPGATFQPRPYETERYPNAVANPIKRVAEAPVSTFSIDVDTASYANVRRFLRDGSRPPRDAVRVEEMINYFDYAYPRPESPSQPFRPLVAVTSSPWSRGKSIIHIGVQGYDPPSIQRPPLNLVFLVDTSGSMMQPDRLPLAKQSLNVLIDQLRPQDRVALVAYAGSAGEVLAPTPGTQKLKLRCAVEALESGGSTAGGAGLALAYDVAQRNFERRKVNRIILMTDGDFNVGIADPRKLSDVVADKRKTGVYLSVYGFGRGNYQDRTMQALAQSGNGTAGYVDSLDEARKLFRDEFARSVIPVADDVKIQVEFNPRRVAEYRLIGYETRLLNREDFNNDRVDAGEVGAGASVTALYEITPVGGPLSADPLRYQAESGRGASGRGGELALFRLRWKPPGGTTSRLIERPITDRDRAPSLAAAPASTRFALAVAGFGQKLKGDTNLEDGFDWAAMRRLGAGATSPDPLGLKAQFLTLVDQAEHARALNEGGGYR